MGVREAPISPRPGPGGPGGHGLVPLAADYLAALLAGERERALRLVVGAAEEGADIRSLYEDVLAPVQREIGRLWQRDEITVAKEHYCTAVTQLVVAQLHPYVFSTPRNGWRLVATSAQGNLHELGIRMVSDLFELEGWDTYYLGANTPHAAVVDAVAEEAADLLLVSATLDEHVDAVAGLIAAARADARTRAVPIMVGGPPFTVPDAPAVGADVVVRSAEEGLALARELMGGR
jgi:MerR family transcriptional regulator, light-induced transcriptional regulator